MPDTDVSWFRSEQFLPHGHCYMWTPGILWMHVVADILIAMAYFAIPFVLIYVARRRRDLPFSWLLVCFGVFIVSCALTHVMDVWNVWHTDYWLEGLVKVATAAASVPTAILLWRSLPFILSVPSQRQLLTRMNRWRAPIESWRHSRPRCHMTCVRRLLPLQARPVCSSCRCRTPMRNSAAG